MPTISAIPNRFEVKWFNPLKGGNLQSGSVESVEGGRIVSMGLPPNTDQDWVILLRIKE